MAATFYYIDCMTSCNSNTVSDADDNAYLYCTDCIWKFPVVHSLRICRFSSCAVVGNADHLKSQKLGKYIDAHDAVLRMNTNIGKGCVLLEGFLCFFQSLCKFGYRVQQQRPVSRFGWRMMGQRITLDIRMRRRGVNGQHNWQFIARRVNRFV